MSDLMATTRPVITNRLVRHDIQASDPSILTDIVQEDTNIVIWPKNEGAGLIHRSPQLPHGLRRLLLTMDFISD